MHGATGWVRPARVWAVGGVTTAWVWYGFARKGKRHCLEPTLSERKKKAGRARAIPKTRHTMAAVSPSPSLSERRIDIGSLPPHELASLRSRL